MLRIVRQPDDAFLLLDHASRQAGWVRGHTVRFAGFASPLDAVAAVIGGGSALAAYLGGTTVLREDHDADRADPRSAEPWGDEPLRRPVRLAHDGTHEWVVLGGRRVARLITPSGARPAGAATRGELAIEFVLPEGVRRDASLTLAQVLYSAVRLHRSGARPDVGPPRRDLAGAGDVAPPPLT